MPEIRLAKLPERVPVKLTILISPELHRALGEYATFYAESYGCEEAVGELIPAMLTSFLKGDRAFVRRQSKP